MTEEKNLEMNEINEQALEDVRPLTAKSSTVTAGRTAMRSWSTAPTQRAAGSSLTREANTATLTPTMFGKLQEAENRSRK